MQCLSVDQQPQPHPTPPHLPLSPSPLVFPPNSFLMEKRCNCYPLLRVSWLWQRQQLRQDVHTVGPWKEREGESGKKGRMNPKEQAITVSWCDSTQEAVYAAPGTVTITLGKEGRVGGWMGTLGCIVNKPCVHNCVDERSNSAFFQPWTKTANVKTVLADRRRTNKKREGQASRTPSFGPEIQGKVLFGRIWCDVALGIRPSPPQWKTGRDVARLHTFVHVKIHQTFWKHSSCAQLNNLSPRRPHRPTLGWKLGQEF